MVYVQLHIKECKNTVLYLYPAILYILLFALIQFLMLWVISELSGLVNGLERFIKEWYKMPIQRK